MKQLSPDSLKARPWHAFQAESSSAPGTHSRWVVEFLVPLAVIALLVAAKAFVMAGVVVGVALIVWLVRGFSMAGRRWLDKALGALANWVGQAVAVVLLAPAFFVVMTLVRVMNRLTGSDPLQLRSGEAPTFWLPSDLETRRARHIRSMFCTERLMQGRLAFVPLAALSVLLAVAAEAGLRWYGFGTPLLYVQDGDVGYYPKPHQRVRYPGRYITVNNYGMRAPDITPQKAPGHFRILMLGDSTLAGTYVANEELYSSLLEKKLNAAAGKPVFEVLNMGVNAWGPLHELAWVKKFGTFDADLAIICGPIGDCFRPRYDLSSLGFTPASGPPGTAIEQIMGELFWRLRLARLGMQWWHNSDEQAQRGLDGYRDLAQLLQGKGAEVMVEVLPTQYEALGVRTNEVCRRLVAQLSERMAGLSVPVDNPEGMFKDVKPVQKIYHDGVHFDRLGHRCYADYLAARLPKASARVRQILEGK